MSRRARLRRRKVAELRDSKACRAPIALRLSPGARRHAEELGGAERSEPRSRRQADGGARRRSSVGVRDFEGVIPPGQYGAGTVIVWDRGTWIPDGDPREGYRQGKLKFELQGEKLHGRWTLVRMRGRGNERQEPWLLIKERDETARPAAEYDITEALPDSVNATNGARSAAKPAKQKHCPEAKSERARRGCRGRCQTAHDRQNCRSLSRRNWRRWLMLPRAQVTGSMRSSSTAIACSLASTVSDVRLFTRTRPRLDVEAQASSRKRSPR